MSYDNDGLTPITTFSASEEEIRELTSAVGSLKDFYRKSDDFYKRKDAELKSTFNSLQNCVKTFIDSVKEADKALEGFNSSEGAVKTQYADKYRTSQTTARKAFEAIEKSYSPPRFLTVRNGADGKTIADYDKYAKLFADRLIKVVSARAMDNQVGEYINANSGVNYNELPEEARKGFQDFKATAVVEMAKLAGFTEKSLKTYHYISNMHKPGYTAGQARTDAKNDPRYWYNNEQDYEEIHNAVKLPNLTNTGKEIIADRLGYTSPKEMEKLEEELSKAKEIKEQEKKAEKQEAKKKQQEAKKNRKLDIIKTFSKENTPSNSVSLVPDSDSTFVLDPAPMANLPTVPTPSVAIASAKPASSANVETSDSVFDGLETSIERLISALDKLNDNFGEGASIARPIPIESMPKMAIGPATSSPVAPAVAPPLPPSATPISDSEFYEKQMRAFNPNKLHSAWSTEMELWHEPTSLKEMNLSMAKWKSVQKPDYNFPTPDSYWMQFNRLTQAATPDATKYTPPKSFEKAFGAMDKLSTWNSYPVPESFADQFAMLDQNAEWSTGPRPPKVSKEVPQKKKGTYFTKYQKRGEKLGNTLQALGMDPKYAQSIGKFAGGAMAVGAVIKKFGDAIGGCINKLGDLSKSVGDVGKAFASFDIENPIGSVTSAISGAGGGIVSGISGMGGLAGGIPVIGGLFSGIFSGFAKTLGASLEIGNATLTSVLKVVKKIAETSPLFKAILEILNLAFNLFFLPVTTLMLQKLMPSIVKLLQASVEGSKLLAEAFDSSGFVTSMSAIIEKVCNMLTNKDVINRIADFMEEGFNLIPKLLEMVLNWMDIFGKSKEQIFSVIQSMFDLFDSLMTPENMTALFEFAKTGIKWITDNGNQILYEIMKMSDIVYKLVPVMEWLANWLYDLFGGNGTGSQIKAISAGLSWTAPGAIIYGISKAMGFASGGYIPATPGGVPCIVGEGGEGEYIIPESKLQNGITLVFNAPVYGMQDFKQAVRTVINEYSTKAAYR